VAAVLAGIEPSAVCRADPKDLAAALVRCLAERRRSNGWEKSRWLSNENMHLRGNAAFIFASLGDDRGFQVIKAILENRSPKRAVFTTDDAGHLNPQLQIRQDRYYAAHLFGDLKDVRAVPILVPLLRDEEVKEVVPWSLGQIGDKSAIRPLKEALSDNSLTMRASALRALEKLEAKEKSP